MNSNNKFDNLKFENTISSFFKLEINEKNPQNDVPHEVKSNLLKLVKIFLGERIFLLQSYTRSV